jgi:hypothetical protein
MEELSGYRDDGEEPIGNLELVASSHRVPVAKLREVAEQQWGSPLETDRERNKGHYEATSKRLAEEAHARAYRDEIIEKAKVAATDVWDNCCPSGEPDWDYCAKRFLSLNKVEGAGLRIEVAELFKKVGSDFRKAVALYRKWQVK